MPRSLSTLFPLLLQLIACTYRCRKTIAQLDLEIKRISQSTPHGILIAELSRGAQEMMLTIAKYEAVCNAAVVLLTAQDLEGEGDSEGN